MRIKNLRRLDPHSRTYEWRTVEGDSGVYYTFADGTGMHYFRDDKQFHLKIATCEKFQICKTISGTRRKLNRIFAEQTADPTPEKPWKL